MNWCIYRRMHSMEITKSIKERQSEFNTFSNDLLFISGAFTIFDFRVKKEIKVELNTTLSVLIYFP